MTSIIKYLMIRLEIRYPKVVELLARLKRKILENRNDLIIEEYYNKSYDYFFDYDKKYYMDYKLENYNGYIVNAGMLQNKEKIHNNYWNKIYYFFTLPVDMEVVDKLILRMNRKKYKFICVSWNKDNNWGDSGKWDKIKNELYALLGTYGKEMNFVYYYATSIRGNNNIELGKIKNELLINVDINNIDNLLSKLIGNEEIKKMGIELVHEVEIEDEYDFFKRKEMESLYNEYTITTFFHDFLIFKLNKEFEDYYVLGNHMMRMSGAFEIARDLNVAMEDQLINDKAIEISKKKEIDVSRASKYIQEAYNYYVRYDYDINKKNNNSIGMIEIIPMMFGIKNKVVIDPVVNQLKKNHIDLKFSIMEMNNINVDIDVKKKELFYNFYEDNKSLMEYFENLKMNEMDNSLLEIVNFSNNQQEIYKNVKQVDESFLEIMNITSMKNWAYKQAKLDIANNSSILDSNNVYLEIGKNINPVNNYYGKDVKEILNGHVNMNIVDGSMVRIYPCTHSSKLRYNTKIGDRWMSIEGKNPYLYTNGENQYVSAHPYIKNVNTAEVNFNGIGEEHLFSSKGLVALRNIVENINNGNIKPEVINAIRSGEIDYNKFQVITENMQDVSKEQLANILYEYHSVIESINNIIS